MYVLKLALQKLFSRPVSTLFSVFLFGVGCSIISLIILADKNVETSVRRNFAGIDMVVGAKGSPSQLILSSVLHADFPTGNISLFEAQQIARNPLVKMAIPIALGDNYRGFRIVGTPVEYASLYDAELAAGHWYEKVLDVVLGASVARSTGRGTGDQFYGVHGFHETGHAHREHIYTVTGVLQPTGTVVDNLILTPVESVWKVHEHHHDHEASDASDPGVADPGSSAPNDFDPVLIASIREKIENDEDISLEEMLAYQAYQQAGQTEKDDGKEITAMLLQFRSPAGMIQLTRQINENTPMQAASPALEINRLVSLLSVGFEILSILAWIIIAISALNIFIHLWNTLRADLPDIALMRVAGAGREKVFMMLITQGAAIAVLGWMTGILLSRLIWFILPSFHFMATTPSLLIMQQEVVLLIYAVMAGIMASLIPAWTAYNTDVHFTLSRK